MCNHAPGTARLKWVKIRRNQLTPDGLPNYVIPVDTSDRWWEDLVGVSGE